MNYFNLYVNDMVNDMLDFYIQDDYYFQGFEEFCEIPAIDFTKGNKDELQ